TTARSPRTSLRIPPVRRSTPFPYTTLFRSYIYMNETTQHFIYSLLSRIDKESLVAKTIKLLNSRNHMDILFSNKFNNICTYLLRSEEHTSELQSRFDLVCRLLLEIKYECS